MRLLRRFVWGTLFAFPFLINQVIAADNTPTGTIVDTESPTGKITENTPQNSPAASVQPTKFTPATTTKTTPTITPGTPKKTASPAPKTSTKLEVLKNNSGTNIHYAGRLSNEKVWIPTSYAAKPMEMRGIWIATIDNIDFGTHDNAEQFKRDFLTVLNNLQSANINTIFFQVRPMNDAFYQSRLNPWSKYLTGTEGAVIANFDPLAFMITESHRRGIQFHAWLNPYRAAKSLDRSKKDYLNMLDANNFARKNPGLVLEINNEGKRLLILDPGDPKVISFLISTVREIIRSYDVDGIHFDDYFYPYGGCGNVDARTFNRYNTKKLSLEDWRRENINTLISGVSKTISEHNNATRKQVQFGISPFGIWRNINNDKTGSLTAGTESYAVQHADTKRWIKEGWIDYIIPQIYWTFENNVAAYAAVTDWWAQAVRGSKVNLYIGHASAFYGVNPGWNNANEIPNQLRYNNKHPEIKGEALFSYRSIFRPENSLMRRGNEILFRELWTKKAALPSCGPYNPPTGGKP